MKKKVTIREVAKLAGVSIGTASKVINNQGNVAANLQKRVYEAINTLNYSPNMIARSLKSSVSNTIAVMLSNITNPFQMTLAKAIEEVILQNDYRLIISSTNENPNIERKNLKLFYEQRVDGIILCTTGNVNDEILKLVELNVPIVLVDRPVHHLPVNVVSDDNYYGMQLLITYLYDLGHRKIGVIHGDINTIHGKIRHDAAISSLENNNLSTEYQYFGDFTYHGGQSGVEYFISLENRPTAIVSSNNIMTAGVLKACQRLNLNIPEDYTVVSFGELEYLWDLIVPKMTVVEQSPKKIGKEAALLIMDQIKRGDNSEVVRKLFKPRLHIGDSSAAVKNILEGEKMKALVNYESGKHKVELREVPIPKIGPKEILLKVKAVGVCGSDLHMYHDIQGFEVKRPVTLGHEFAGIVEDVGSEVTQFKKGDRIVSETPSYVCETCIYCKTGQYNLCPNRLGFGVLADGAMAQYVKTREAICHHIPEGIPFEKAALTEPSCVAYNAVAHHSRIRPGDEVVVFGPGPIGLMCIQIAKLFSPGKLTVVGLEQDANRLEIAKRFGADEVIFGDKQDVVKEILSKGDGFGADLVLDAVGVSATLKQSIEIVRPAGQITKIGWGPAPVGFSLDPLIQKAARLQGSFSHNYPMWEKVLLLMQKGEIDPLPMAKLYPLEDWQKAFEEMDSLAHAKSVILPNN